MSLLGKQVRRRANPYYVVGVVVKERASKRLAREVSTGAYFELNKLAVRVEYPNGQLSGWLNAAALEPVAD